MNGLRPTKKKRIKFASTQCCSIHASRTCEECSRSSTSRALSHTHTVSCESCTSEHHHAPSHARTIRTYYTHCITTQRTMLHHGLRYLAAQDAGVSNWRTHCRSESVERIRECLQSHKTFYINLEEERGGGGGGGRERKTGSRGGNNHSKTTKSTETSTKPCTELWFSIAGILSVLIRYGAYWYSNSLVPCIFPPTVLHLNPNPL